MREHLAAVAHLENTKNVAEETGAGAVQSRWGENRYWREVSHLSATLLLPFLSLSAPYSCLCSLAGLCRLVCV
jgi:hypothetical protein